MRLVIRSVYNNNSVLVEIGEKKQAIISGKGIGFRKRPGDTISATSANNILYLEDDRIKKHFATLLKDVPIDIVVTAFKAIDMAKHTYHYSVLNYIYVTLTDHIFQMYKHLMNGKYQPSMVPDIHERYPTEYAIGKAVLRMINQNLNVHFPDAEIKNIALHFINAKGVDPEQVPTDNLSSSVNRIVKQVFEAYDIKRNLTNQNYFDRLMIHLQYLVERVQTKSLDDHTLNRNIEQDFRRLYPKSYEISGKICDQLESSLRISLNENERVYFIIHIQRLIQENENTNA
ncbi:PRD domain-containing protein [Pediococcus cellicola]|uniref:Prd domain protein n=1 Tax=Pediococcus cellicola TaxID=319652 RepID=A0A0R2ILN3_9LACO|nr:PRD domain-containing protein [Pediococcus cellicola]KRN65873.1 prd domain protein [Pediococcus cellicola]GEL15687.1 transcription antiterminator lact [Pediococcus cellicola]